MLLIPRGWIARCLILWIGLLIADSLAAQSARLAPDPRLRIGELPNGFRYVIFPRRQASGQVSFRLVVKAGSVDETESERGLAHFLEHMVFNGTTHYAPGSLENFLRQNGLALGADANANTHYGYTDFRFDLGTASSVPSFLQLFRDFADGATFERNAVEHEKKVILAEFRLRNTAENRAWQTRQEIDLQGSLLANREPIGLEFFVETAKPDQLKKLYRRLYRPDRMELIVAGAVDADVVEKQIRATFSDLSADGPAPTRRALAFPKEANWRVAVTRSELHNGNVFALIADSAIEPVQTEADNRRAFLRGLAEKMFELRLQRLSEADPNKISFCNAQVTDELSLTRELSCQISPRNSEWRDAATRLQMEVRDSLEHGFTPAEVKEMTQLVARFGQEFVAQDENTLSADKANDLVNDYLNDRVTRSPSQDLEDIARYSPEVTPVDFLAPWRDVWNGWRTAWLGIGTTFPEKPSRDDVLALLEKNAGAPLPERRAVKEVIFPYDHFGSAGEIANRRRLESLDTEEIVFKNGVRLLVKKTQLAPNSVSMLLRVGNGRLDEPTDKPGLGALGSFWVLGGLKELRWDELTRFLLLHPGSFSVATSCDALTLSSETRPEETLTYQQLMAAYLIDPGFAKDRFPIVAQDVLSRETQLWDGPTGIFQEEVGPREHNGDSRYFSARRRELDRYTAEDVVAWLKPYLQTSPVTLVVVGDVDVEKVIAQTAETIAAISRSGAAVPTSDAKSNVDGAPASTGGVNIKWPTWTEKPNQVTYNFETNSPMSAVCIDWPVREAIDAKTLAEAKLLSEIMTERARAKIRQDRGQSYATEFTFTFLSGPRAGGWIRFFSDCKAADVQRIVDESVGLLKGLHQKGVTSAELSRAKTVLLAAAEAERQKNDFWVGVLHNRVLDETSVERSLDFPAKLREVQTTDLDRFGKTHLRLDTAFLSRVIAQPPKTQ